ILTPSCRRVYTSRACSTAIAASAACKLPTCLCSSPERERMNTSYKGQSFAMSLPSSSRLVGCGARFLLLRVGGGRLANPTPILVRRAPSLQPLPIARPIAFQHRLKLTPVNGPEVVVLRRLIPGKGRVRNLQSQEIRLRRRDINELLPQLVIGEALD